MAAAELVIVVHNHQPVGNLDEVFVRAHDLAYAPFLELLDRHPAVRVTLRYSAAILEWAELHHPEFLTHLDALVQRGQVELLGGGMYEPVLSLVPQADAVAQIRVHGEQLAAMFGAAPSGVWLAQCVWEPHFPALLRDGGLRFALLEDQQFLRTGLEPSALTTPFRTEDQGKWIDVLPIARWASGGLLSLEPDLLVSRWRSWPGLLVVAESGERLGLWGDSHRRSYQEGYLERLFQILEGWATMTASEGLAAHPSPPPLYLPCSASEPAGRASSLMADSSHSGFWRNFLVRYPEVAHMQKRMALVSAKLSRSPRTPQQAKIHLWRAQTGDPYWHHGSGGSYHNFLRSSVYRNLIEAENLIEPNKYSWLEIRLLDFDADGEEEVIAESHTMNAYFKPSQGGAITELDFRPRAVNLSDSFVRRPEPYQAALGSDIDRYLRRCLVDHFIGGETTLAEFAAGKYLELGDYVSGRFESGKYRNRVTLRRQGSVRGPGGVPVAVELRKSVTLQAKDSSLLIEYRIANNGDWDVITRFASEWNLSLSGPGAGRYLVANGQRIGTLEATAEHRRISQLALIDEWLRVAIYFEFESKDALVWTFPISTLHEGQDGQPVRAYQSNTVVPVWDLDLPKGRSRRLTFRLRVAALGVSELRAVGPGAW